MFLQTGLTAYRKFRERWVLLSFLPELLQSGTAHMIPLLLTDTDSNWNEPVKIIVTAGFERIPKAGDVPGDWL